MAKKRPKLDTEAVEAWLKDRRGWKLKDEVLSKEFKFKSFRDSIVFTNRVATLADDANHHPDIDIRYSKVTLHLTTHDSGGITDKDLELAKAVDFATSAR
jgi:4a-hydroxytetrahydrobiopterin dehydratase